MRAFLLVSLFYIFSTGFCSAQSITPKPTKYVPQFGDYPVARRFTGPSAQPILDDDEKRNYRTRLRQAAREGANFGGRYAVVTWGCGTGCNRGAIVNVQTGQVFIFPFSLVTTREGSEEDIRVLGPDFGFQKSSALLRLDGEFEADKDWWDPTHRKGGHHYFVFDGNSLLFVTTIPLGAPLQP